MKLMAEHIARFHSRDHAPVKVEIGAVYGGGYDFDYRITRINDLRISDGINANIAFPIPTERLLG